MDVAIVGPPGVGRTTVFRALLAHRAPKAGRDGRTSIGAIHVQDPRLDQLSSQFNPRKTTPIEIRIHDPCQSLEPSFPQAELEEMKRMDALALVVSGFADPSAELAVAAFRSLVGTLCLEDLVLVEKRLKTASRDGLSAGVRDALEAASSVLEAEGAVGTAELSPAHRVALRTYNLLTDRNLICVLNTAENRAAEPVPPELVSAAEQIGVPALSLCGALEAEMAELPPEEREAFLAEYGVAEPAGSALTRALVAACDVIPFFTVGPDECRAWAIARGTTARRAAGKVHSDIERGFIRAEVIPAEDLIGMAGGLTEAKKRGLLRLEGKDYVVCDGEVVHFRFNV